MTRLSNAQRRIRATNRRTDRQLAHELNEKGYRTTDVALRPDDIIEGVLVMQRGKQTTVLHLDHMTAREADFHLTEKREDGWRPKRWLRQGKEPGLSARLGARRGIA